MATGGRWLNTSACKRKIIVFGLGSLYWTLWAMGGWQWDFLLFSHQARSLTETRYEEDPVLQTSCSYPCGSEACYRHECWLYRYINTWSSWPFLKGTKNFQRGNGGSPTGTNFVQLRKIRVHRISKAINQVCKLHEVAPRAFPSLRQQDSFSSQRGEKMWRIFRSYCRLESTYIATHRSRVFFRVNQPESYGKWLGRPYNLGPMCSWEYPFRNGERLQP